LYVEKIILKFTLKFKEGGKVNGHYTTKTWILGVSLGPQEWDI